MLFLFTSMSVDTSILPKTKIAISVSIVNAPQHKPKSFDKPAMNLVMSPWVLFFASRTNAKKEFGFISGNFFLATCYCLHGRKNSLTEDVIIQKIPSFNDKGPQV